MRKARCFLHMDYETEPNGEHVKVTGLRRQLLRNHTQL